jgi:hypothetical protein
MDKKPVPERVELREERTWVSNRECPRDPDPTGDWVEYKKKKSSTLDAIIAKADGVPLFTLEGWFTAVKPDLRKKCAVHLIPGQIQEILGLPVRQVYIHEDDEVYRIEKDGRVTVRLFPACEPA